MKASKRDLIGRCIVAVDWRPFKRTLHGSDPIRQGNANDPVLTLDNGRRVWFVVDETEVGEYGVDICVTEKEHIAPKKV